MSSLRNQCWLCGTSSGGHRAEFGLREATESTGPHGAHREAPDEASY